MKALRVGLRTGLRTGLRVGIVNNQIVTRVDLGAIRYGRKSGRSSARRIARRIVLLIVGILLSFSLAAAALVASSRPAHGATVRVVQGQVVCVLGGTSTICPPSLEIGNPPTYTVFVFAPIVARTK